MSKAKRPEEIKRWTVPTWEKHFGKVDDLERFDDWSSPEAQKKIQDAEKAGLLWTATDYEGDIWFGNGYHYVNRMYYLIAERPCPEGVTVDFKYW